MSNLTDTLLSCADYRKYRSKLQFFRIYFDGIVFNRITKDSRVKLPDMIAGVGGTLGLFAGFSIISGIEILYFTLKIILDHAQNRGMRTHKA